MILFIKYFSALFINALKILIPIFSVNASLCKENFRLYFTIVRNVQNYMKIGPWVSLSTFCGYCESHNIL